VQTRSWETQDGSKRTTTEIIAENISLLGVQNAVADESVQTDSAPAAASTPAPAAPVASEAPAQPAEQEVPSVPEVQHKSEVKVEDLPF
jgi:single-stranded DNA-binding protein